MMNKIGVFGRLSKGLSRTRDRIIKGIQNLVSSNKIIDAALLEELEDILISSDMGVKRAQILINNIKEKVDSKEISTMPQLVENIKSEIKNTIKDSKDCLIDTQAQDASPYVIMVVGVNGVGKTTTIGKLAHRYRKQGKSVILAAGDTFRAAAIEQLHIWAKRTDADIIRHKSGADPSAVIFDAMAAGKARNTDIIIADTAGRLHTKSNLMEELKKIKRVMGKEIEGSPHEILMIMDATTGQNAISQVRLFNEAVSLTGLAVAKLDGTAKGGIIIGIIDEFKIPVKYIGIGEDISDLIDFDGDEFVESLFNTR
ncbi:MAG: signal recognition particle-docking protein FtsY [Nitrospirota bacterium]